MVEARIVVLICLLFGFIGFVIGAIWACKKTAIYITHRIMNIVGDSISDDKSILQVWQKLKEFEESVVNIKL